MIRVLICEDEILFAEALKECLSGAFSRRSIDAEIQIRECGTAFLAQLDAWLPDLIFLDLKLPDIDGYRLAQEFRSKRLNAEIVFVTNYPERMPDAFEHRPIGFLPKPVSDAEIDTIIRRFLQYYQNTHASYTVNTREQCLRIEIKDIQYFESKGHHVLIYRSTDAEPVHHIRRLDDIADELSSFPFIRPHKSFLVHADAIARIDKSNMTIMLTNGVAVPISRSFYAQTLEQYIHYQLR